MSNVSQKSTHTAKGVVFGALAAAFYGMIPLFTAPLYDAGYNEASVLVFRYIVTGVMLAALLRIRGISFRLSPNQWIAACYSGLIMGLSSLFLFISYAKMDMGIAATILFLYPTIVAFIMSIFFRERLSIYTLIGTLTAIAGVLLLSVGDKTGAVTLEGVIYGLLAALVYAIYFVCINKSPIRKLSGEKLTFFSILFGFPVFIVYAFMGEGLQLITGTAAWLNLIGLALFTTVLSFVLTARAILIIGATKTAILGALEPVTAVALGVCFLGEHLSWRIAIGIVLILFAIICVVSGNNIPSILRQRKLNRLRKIRAKRALYHRFERARLLAQQRFTDPHY